MNQNEDVIHHGWLASVNSPALLPRATKSGKALFGLLSSSGRLSLFQQDPLAAMTHSSSGKRQSNNSNHNNGLLECLDLGKLTAIGQAVISIKRSFAVRFDCPEPVEFRLKTKLQAEQWLMCLRLQHSHIAAELRVFSQTPVFSLSSSSSFPVLESDARPEENPFEVAFHGETTPSAGMEADSELDSELRTLGELIKSSSEDSLFGADGEGWLNAADAFSSLDRHADELPPSAPALAVAQAPPALGLMLLDDDGFAAPTGPSQRRPSVHLQAPPTPRGLAASRSMMLPPVTPRTAASQERRRSIFGGLFGAKKSASSGNLHQLRQQPSAGSAAAAEEPQAIRPS